MGWKMQGETQALGHVCCTEKTEELFTGVIPMPISTSSQFGLSIGTYVPILTEVTYYNGKMPQR